jgi:ribosomal protein S18 acetylase RimI-like enzyme
VVAAALRKERAQAGVRPFDPYRDLKAVAELICAAFGDTLDPTGRAALEEMRRVARWGPVLWWLYSPTWNSPGVVPGFVWVEGGHVVGNVSLRRAPGRNGFLIGNVAVHPDCQGRGIAGGLMEAAMGEISSRGGRWAGLEVRVDNRVAHRLYERLGFREVGRVLHMLRPAGLGSVSPVAHPSLRRGRSGDSVELIRLLRAVVPEQQRPLLELREEDYRPGWERTLDHWLSGRRESWWVVEEHGTVCGAVRALRERGHRPDRLEVLVAPGQSERFASVLVRRGVASLRSVRKRMTETVLPTPAEHLVAELEAEGFRKVRTLAQMRLELSHCT